MHQHLSRSAFHIINHALEQRDKTFRRAALQRKQAANVKPKPRVCGMELQNDAKVFGIILPFARADAMGFVSVRQRQWSLGKRSSVAWN